MAQNYASKTLSKIDERWNLEAKTALICNKGMTIEFNGVNSVTIYNVDTVAEGDYTRSGADRFGALVELGTGVQTMTLSQDKSFTFTVDRGNLEDSQMVQEANKAVKRQVREVSIPATDVYRLAVLTSYADTNNQGAQGTTLLVSTTYAGILTEQAALTDALVPEEGRVCFIVPTVLNLLKRDPEFAKDCDKSYADSKTGVYGKVDGLTIVVIPSSYVMAKFQFMIVHEDVLVSPVKFNSVRVLDNQRGIDGVVAEGRRYYDAFILGQKTDGIRLSLSA